MTHEEIDDLARALPAYRPTPPRVEQTRTAILAGAPGVTQLKPSRRATYAVAAAVALAAAAGVLWMLDRSTASSGSEPQVARADRRGTVVALGEARFELGPVGLDEVVRVHDGMVRVSVAPLAADERFRILTEDAEVEVRGTEFDVEVRGDHLQSVVCASGQVEVRPEYTEAVLLDAGERWDAPKLAVETDETTGGPSEPVATAPAEPMPEPADAGKPAPARRAPPKVQKQSSSVPLPPAKAAATAPGEEEFRAGWAALKAGEPAKAAEEFAAARQVKGTVLAEDASFWEGVALARAGKSSKAIAALRRFVTKYPSSSRAAEAAAKLGWLLYEAGDLDAAEKYFKSAEDDVVPKVKKSARDGLEAIARTRGDR